MEEQELNRDVLLTELYGELAEYFYDSDNKLKKKYHFKQIKHLCKKVLKNDE